MRTVRWLYQRGVECKGLTHCVNMSNGEEFRAQCSTADRETNALLPKESRSVNIRNICRWLKEF